MHVPRVLDFSDTSFDLESFLREEAKIKAEGVKEYLPLLKKNKVDTEEVLMHLLPMRGYSRSGASLLVETASLSSLQSRSAQASTEGDTSLIGTLMEGVPMRHKSERMDRVFAN